MSRINQNVEFRNIKNDFRRARDTPEKIRLLEKLLTMDPSYWGLSTQKKGFRAQLEALKASMHKSHKPNLDNPYEMKRSKYQACIIGAPNSGKSTLLNRLTGTKVMVSDIPFSTYRPQVGNLTYNDVNIQLVEVPAIYPGDSEKDANKYRFIKNADLGIIVLGSPEEFEMVLLELWGRDINIGERDNLAGLVVYRGSIPDTNLTKMSCDGDVAKEIYGALGIKRVYIDNPQISSPLTFTQDQVTVEEVRKILEKKYRLNFKLQKVRGEKSENESQFVAVNYALNDGDHILFKN